MVKLKDKIKFRLDVYMGFDSDLLFKSSPTENDYITKKRLVRIFGGAIRDSIADMPIHDIDILVGADSIKLVKRVLIENGYKYFDRLSSKDLSYIYSNIQVISEPHTWMKGDKIIQLIRPRVNSNVNKHQAGLRPKDFEEATKNYEASFIKLIQNVDISCCGLSYDGNLYENYEGAILHCLTKSFSVNKSAIMYSADRFQHRKYKLEERGWKETKNSMMRRDKVIEYLLDKDINLDEIDYINECLNPTFLEKSKGFY